MRSIPTGRQVTKVGKVCVGVGVGVYVVGIREGTKRSTKAYH